MRQATLDDLPRIIQEQQAQQQAMLPAQPIDRGFLGNMFQGITKPFRTLGGLIGEGYDVVSGLATGDLEKTSGQGDVRFLDPLESERFRRLSSTPMGALQLGTQTSAGIGSFLVPGGAGWAGLGKAGAAGGLSGYGTSEGEDLGTLARDTGIGAGSGMALYGIGKGVQKVLKPKANLTANGLVKKYGTYENMPDEQIDLLPDTERLKLDKILNIDKTPSTMNAGQRLGRNMQYTGMGIKGKAGDLEFSGMVEKDKNAIDWALRESGLNDRNIKNIDKLPSELSKIRTNAVNALDIKMETKPIIQKAAKALMRSSNIASQEEAEAVVRQRLNEILLSQKAQTSLGRVGGQQGLNMLMNDSMPVNQRGLFELTQQLGDDTFKVMKLEKAGNFDPTKHINLDAGRQIDKVVSDILAKKSPTVANANRAYFALFRQNPGLVQSYNRGANISVTGGQGGLLREVWDKGQYQIGKGVEKVSGGGLPSIPSLGISANVPNIPKAAYPLAGMATVGLGQGQQSIQEEPMQDFTGQAKTTTQVDDQTLKLRDALALELMNKPKLGSKVGYSYDEAINVANLMVRNQTGVDLGGSSGGSGIKSMTEKKQVDLGNAGLRAADQAINIYKKDPSVVMKQLVPGKWLSRDFDNALFRAVESLLRARSGAAVPEQEVRRYMSGYAPQFGDNQQVAEMKFTALVTDLQDMARPMGLEADTVIQQPTY